MRFLLASRSTQIDDGGAILKVIELSESTIERRRRRRRKAEMSECTSFLLLIRKTEDTEGSGCGGISFSLSRSINQWIDRSRSECRLKSSKDTFLFFYQEKNTKRAYMLAEEEETVKEKEATGNQNYLSLR